MNNRMQQFKPGDFSVGLTHSFLVAYGKQGGTPDMLQKAFEDQELMNRVVRYMRLGGYEPSTDQKVARAILGEGNFFGPAEWFGHFGVKFTKAQLAKVSQIPWSESELKSPKLNQPHFLFLGIEKFDGKSLNLPVWHEIFPSKDDHPKFAWYWHLSEEQDFRLKTCRLRWYYMPIGIAKGSNNLSYADRVAMLSPLGYEVPNTTERVTGNILFYLLNKKEYLDKDYWASTCDQSKAGNRVNVGGNRIDGLIVGDWDDGAYSSIGVAASKKIL